MLSDVIRILSAIGFRGAIEAAAGVVILALLMFAAQFIGV